MSRNEQTSARSRREIEADLSENRTRIEHNLELLEDRFTPGTLLDQAWRYARTKSENGTTSRLREAVVGNPLPVTLMGVGLAWLLFAGREGSVPSRPTASTGPRTPPAARGADNRSHTAPGRAADDGADRNAASSSGEDQARQRPHQTAESDDRDALDRHPTAQVDPNSPSTNKSRATSTGPAGITKSPRDASSTSHNR